MEHDKELMKYSKLIGAKQYHKEYNVLINRVKRNQNVRYSKTNHDVDLNAIKEKYKNGVTKDILIEWLVK